MRLVRGWTEWRRYFPRWFRVWRARRSLKLSRLYAALAGLWMPEMDETDEQKRGDQ